MKFNILWALPLFLFSSAFLSFQSQSVSTPKTTNPIVLDTLPNTVDTVYVYDPTTGKETITVIVNQEEKPKHTDYKPKNKGIDTIIIYNPEIKKEMIIVINNETEKIDTIKHY